MEVEKLVKLMELEWRKLKQGMIVSELVIYWGVLMFLPMFFIKMVSADFGQNYSTIIPLMMAMQMGFILFGASLINQVVIDEYKNKTMSLSFSYPLSRKKLIMAKVLFISLFVFASTLVSFILSGISTYILDQIFHIINGQPTMEEIKTYVGKMLVHAFMISMISFIPLFTFGVWKRATITTVLCAIFFMQFQNFSYLLNINLNPDVVNAALSLLGVFSVFLSVHFIDRLGDV